MPAISFMPRFRDAVFNGLAEARYERQPIPGVKSKRQTIRKARADERDIRAGQVVRVWVAQRSPGREFLGETPPVRRQAIRIYARGAVYLDGLPLTDRQTLNLAKRDGFASTAEFLALFEKMHGLPFRGFVFRW